MKDNLGRDIYFLRLSVTDRCNLRCIYCIPETGVKKLRQEDLISTAEITEIVRVAALCGITKVRVTGGEPLLRSELVEICRQIAQTQGINELCITTNGILIPKFAKELKAAGVNRLNISLDSLNRETYMEVKREDLFDEALEGVRVAIETGFSSIKINAVLIGGVNDKDILDMLELTRKHMVNVRFIEIMPIGECAKWAASRFVSSKHVLQIAPQLEKVGTDGVSILYKLPDGLGTVGLISPVSSHFCPTCNRIRVTPDAILKPCLHSDCEINLRGMHGEQLEKVMRNAIFNKPVKHELDSGSGSACIRNMNMIGG